MTFPSALRHEAASEYRPAEVVVIAASAGGLEALQSILPTLPPTFPASVVVLLHRTVGRPGILRMILARASRLRVKDIDEGETLAPGIVYIAPADQHVHITQDHRFTFQNGQKINYVHASADPLFRTAAAVFGARAIGVVLTGGGRNGAGGARAIRDQGGVVIAQDPATSRQGDMPLAAINAGAVTNILPLDRIGPELNALTSEHGARAAAATRG